MFNSTIKSTIEATLKASGAKFSSLQKSPRKVGKEAAHHLCYKTTSGDHETITSILDLLQTQDILGWAVFSSRDGDTLGVYRIIKDEDNALIK
jgi:hypothetical protein